MFALISFPSDPSPPPPTSIISTPDPVRSQSSLIPTGIPQPFSFVLNTLRCVTKLPWSTKSPMGSLPKLAEWTMKGAMEAREEVVKSS